MKGDDFLRGLVDLRDWDVLYIYIIKPFSPLISM